MKSSGAPDYYSSLGRIMRGETYVHFDARPDEKLKIFVTVHPVGVPLGVGVTDYLFDFETFIDTPYESPVGWRCDFREWMLTYNGLVRLDVSTADFPTLVLHVFPQSRFLTHEYEQIIFFDTIYWDPLAASAHEWTFTITNVDTVPLYGAAQVAMVMTDISSEYPETKKVRCLACGHINTVPLKETRVTCEECGATFFAPFFPGRTI